MAVGIKIGIPDGIATDRHQFVLNDLLDTIDILDPLGRYRCLPEIEIGADGTASAYKYSDAE
jgi:hypothetical protein